MIPDGHDGWILAGRVQELHRYPVKSMSGETVDEIHVGWHGLAGDRRYAFLRVGSRSGLPWLSAREFPRLVTYQSYYSDDEAVRERLPVVVTPRGEKLQADDPALLLELSADAHKTLQLVQLWRGAYDAMDVSMITTQSLHAIGAAVGRELESQRFRPNITIDATGARAYPEDKWVGRTLAFGGQPDGLRLRAARKDDRCAIVNFDPASAVSDPTILREIVRMRRNMLGVYAIVERPGTIRKDDSVWLRNRG